jgi:hypothetical protein
VFLRNHREAIAAMDFFTVPTLTFGVLYGFFVIDHDRRKILHLKVTENPSAPWVALQLRQTWAYDQPQRFLIFDRDAKFNADVVATVIREVLDASPSGIDCAFDVAEFLSYRADHEVPTKPIDVIRGVGAAQVRTDRAHSDRLIWNVVELFLFDASFT